MKPTTVAGSRRLDLPGRFGHLRCTHGQHEGLIGLDEKGRFRTRNAQSYPSDFCKALAASFVSAMSEPDFFPDVACEEPPQPRGPARPAPGERFPVPEVASCWDDPLRWAELRRWTWRFPEHNNILEARASLAAVATMMAKDRPFGRRAVLMTDSQVTLGALAKGRSKVRVLNEVCRRVAGLALSHRARLHWRYVRTWRNHADAPSRGLPFGALPVRDLQEERLPAGAELPEFFYQRTRG